MLENFLRKRAPMIGGKAHHMQKQIYDMQVIYSEYLSYYTNRVAILHKNNILSIQYLSPNLLFENYLPN